MKLELIRNSASQVLKVRLKEMHWDSKTTSEVVSKNLIDISGKVGPGSIARTCSMRSQASPIFVLQFECNTREWKSSKKGRAWEHLPPRDAEEMDEGGWDARLATSSYVCNKPERLVKWSTHTLVNICGLACLVCNKPLKDKVQYFIGMRTLPPYVHLTSTWCQFYEIIVLRVSPFFSTLPLSLNPNQRAKWGRPE